eukprot:NODE_2658_length_563_cov_133.535019_g2280_i0.p1 GENE.NODE_2658_length_563_cov_133.535019_g2280_i0~~NODE_2658_length_563_cov_133.535019_g2280_i0.p1  ORF type:complete len:139 (+),score=43.76 NODE_2658_length_563_cov_133.535019_g2280_i0:51-467(+)
MLRLLNRLPRRAMSISVVTSPNAPAAVGPYSQAVRHGNTLYLSGQIGFAPGETTLKEGIEAQTEQVLKNLGAVLEAGGSSYDKVVKCTVLLDDMSHFATVNGIYEKYFSTHKPARACYAAKALPRGALVEIEAIAAIE